MDQLPGLKSDYPYDALLAASAQYSYEVLEEGVKQRHRARRSRPEDSQAPRDNVVGVAVGEKITGQSPTGLASVILYVRRKFPRESVEPSHRLPRTLHGIPVDVVETGSFVALGCAAGLAVQPKSRQRPAAPGSSIGGTPGHGGTGTFGALVRRLTGDGLFILSNHHVLADPDSTSPGDAVFQPGPDDEVEGEDTRIGNVADVVPLLPPPATNRVDAAIARVLDPQSVSTHILGIGAPTSTRAAVVGRTVRKFGRSTQCRIGRIDSVPHARISVTFPHANFTEFMFIDQIVIRSSNPAAPFSDKGDSGALVLDGDTTQAVGLLFAGNTNPNANGVVQGIHSLANPIDLVLADLGATFA
jgi:hypothetical protein